MRTVNATTPFRVRAGNPAMSNPPSHNFGLKVRKVFRFPIQLPATPAALTTASIATAVFAECGFAPPANFNIGIHGASIYGIPPSGADSNVDLEVKVYDIENPTANNQVANFNDRCSNAGIAQIHLKFPVNDRPTFNASTAATNVFSLVGTTGAEVLVDLDITLTNTPANSFLFVDNSNLEPVDALLCSPFKSMVLSTLADVGENVTRTHAPSQDSAPSATSVASSLYRARTLQALNSRTL